VRLSPDRENKWPYLLSEGYDVKSIETWDYNCIAFAADVDDEWWWPDAQGDGIWPISWREVSKDCFIAAFQSLGYFGHESCDGSLESGYEKIAVYLLNGIPTHAAKQLSDGRWKSKLGPWEDIEHNTTKAVEEYIYGKAVVFMKRQIRRLRPTLTFGVPIALPAPRSP
jgi:hypothetical protein